MFKLLKKLFSKPSTPVFKSTPNFKKTIFITDLAEYNFSDKTIKPNHGGTNLEPSDFYKDPGFKDAIFFPPIDRLFNAKLCPVPLYYVNAGWRMY